MGLTHDAANFRILQFVTRPRTSDEYHNPMAENSNSSVTVKVGALNSSVLLLKIAQDSYVLQFSLINSRGKYELLRVELNVT